MANLPFQLRQAALADTPAPGFPFPETILNPRTASPAEAAVPPQPQPPPSAGPHRWPDPSSPPVPGQAPALPPPRPPTPHPERGSRPAPGTAPHRARPRRQLSPGAPPGRRTCGREPRREAVAALPGPGRAGPGWGALRRTRAERAPAPAPGCGRFGGTAREPPGLNAPPPGLPPPRRRRAASPSAPGRRRTAASARSPLTVRPSHDVLQKRVLRRHQPSPSPGHSRSAGARRGGFAQGRADPRSAAPLPARPARLMPPPGPARLCGISPPAASRAPQPRGRRRRRRTSPQRPLPAAAAPRRRAARPVLQRHRLGAARRGAR